jgi:ribosomal 30S subunit maturation factor RimM
MRRYRWLREGMEVLYTNKQREKLGMVCAIPSGTKGKILIIAPGKIKNCLVDFGGKKVVTSWANLKAVK